METIRKALWPKVESALLKSANFRANLTKSRLKAKDEGLGRECIGTDRFGNNYYQYYSYHGLPTRRVVLYKFFDTNKFHIDPHFLAWLRKQDLLAPTPEELEKLYLKHDEFLERALQWDQEQEAMIADWENQKKALDQQFEHREALSSPDVEKWDPSKPKGSAS